MSQIIQHYQTSFVIQNETQTGENKLYQAQRLIGEWVKSHEGRRFRESGRDKSASFLIDGNFQRRAYYSSKFSWCTTDYCIEDDSLAWAVRYTHRDACVRDVFWVSDIGLRAFTATGRLVVSVKISYKISTEFAITGQKFEPDVSIPWCVEGLLETFDGSHFYSGEQDVTSGIMGAVVVKNADHAQQVLAYIDLHDRKLAVVGRRISGRSSGRRRTSCLRTERWTACGAASP